MAVQKRLILDDAVVLDHKYQQSRFTGGIKNRNITPSSRVSDKRTIVSLSKKSIPKFSMIQAIINDYKTLNIAGDTGEIDTGMGKVEVPIERIKILKAIALNSRSVSLDYAEGCCDAFMEIMRQTITKSKPMLATPPESSSDFRRLIFNEILMFYFDECS